MNERTEAPKPDTKKKQKNSKWKKHKTQKADRTMSHLPKDRELQTQIP